MDQKVNQETLYQVWAEDTKTKLFVAVPFFPRMAKEAVDRFANEMSTMIAAGREKRYSNPKVIPYVRS
jgi:hypothetical protein